jgi:hypothetical protein
VVRLLLALALVVACLLAPAQAQANSRDLKWRTLKTEHFYIHYYQGSEAAAERAAMLLERAHARLAVGLGHEPWLRTHVTMTDATDSANGSANANPYPRINANITAPDSMSVLESYDDWFDILLTHEYVHVVHLDTIHGIPRIVNALLGFGVLGKVWAPNIVQPRWMVEGLATAEESRLSSQGRHRSAQFDMMLRMAVLEHGFLPIDRVSSGANVFPHGTSVYLYGLHFMHYLVTHYGHDKVRELSHLYGGQAIPFRIHIALEKVLGIDFHQLWQEFELETTRRFEAQARAIRARGIREGRRLTYSRRPRPRGTSPATRSGRPTTSGCTSTRTTATRTRASGGSDRGAGGSARASASAARARTSTSSGSTRSRRRPPDRSCSAPTTWCSRSRWSTTSATRGRTCSCGAGRTPATSSS